MRRFWREIVLVKISILEHVACFGQLNCNPLGIAMKRSLPLAFLFAVTFVAAGFFTCQTTLAQNQSDSDGWETMFNGTDLTGWKVNENKKSVYLEDGCLVTHGARAHAFYVGANGNADFTNFHFKAKVKTTKGANSGIYFHTRFQESGWPNRGYEAQVNNTQKDKKKTGGLYNVQDNFTPPCKDDEWFDYEIIVQGKHIVVKINDKTISDYTEPDDLDRPERCLSHGTFALQAHDPGSKVFYKDLMVKQLDVAVTHSFLGVGKANRTVIVNESGEVEWKWDMPASDGWVLPSGNVLLALYKTKGFPNGGVIEVNRATNEIVWEYKGQQKEVSTVVPLKDNTYLVSELGDEPRAVVINQKGDVLNKMPLACQKKNAHMQTRMLRVLPNGNYIAPHLLDFAVKEYEPTTGKVVNSFATDERGRDKHDWPFTAIRLENGNTVIGCTNGNRVIEVDGDGKIVWSVTNDDLGENLIDDACGIQRLPNGNTVIASYHAKGDKVKLLEVTPEKKVVWRFSGMNAGFHHFQILTTNGKPQENNTWK